MLFLWQWYNRNNTIVKTMTDNFETDRDHNKTIISKIIIIIWHPPKSCIRVIRDIVIAFRYRSLFLVCRDPVYHNPPSFFGLCQGSPSSLLFWGGTNATLLGTITDPLLFDTFESMILTFPKKRWDIYPRSQGGYSLLLKLGPNEQKMKINMKQMIN